MRRSQRGKALQRSFLARGDAAMGDNSLNPSKHKSQHAPKRKAGLTVVLTFIFGAAVIIPSMIALAISIFSAAAAFFE